MKTLPSARRSSLRCRGIAALLFCWISLPHATAQITQPEAPAIPIQIRHYSIDVMLDPAHHSLTANTRVDFTALQNLTTVAFQLNPVVRVASVVDDQGKQLEFSQGDGKIVVTAANSLTPGGIAAWKFVYSGVFDGTPASVFRQASIGEPVSYLLYQADWFPVAGEGLDRFTAEMHVHVPVGERALGGGPTGTPHPDANGDMVFDFDWPHPGFPGTIIAGKFQEPAAGDSGSHVLVYLIDYGASGKAGAIQIPGKEVAATAAKQFAEFTSQFGPTATGRLSVVELPNGTLPATSAPEMAAVAADQLEKGKPFRLLANTIAHQWWGNRVSAGTSNDTWITNGMCRYAELEYLQRVSKPAVAANAILNVSASALAYESVPLANVARFPVLSPQFDAMTYDKGAMIFRMLQWQIGDAAFQQTLHDILSQPDKSISSAEVEKIAEAASRQNLRPFFTQWLNNTGAPTLDDKWTLYRLGNNQGFRILGEIDEDLDLFQMPVDVRVETEGKTVDKRVEAMGPQTQFSIDTVGIPRAVSLDPERRLLRNDNDLQVRTHILRGLAQAAENDDAGAIREYRAALAVDATSSLASYRLGEIYFQQRNYQAAEDAFRAALNGDGLPKWTEVWSELELGKIFDASGERDRAINQYREALEIQDDTSGALTLAGDYLKRPYAAAADAERR